LNGEILSLEEMVAKVDNMIPFMKVRAYVALEAEGKEQAKDDAIRKLYEKSRNWIINITNINDEFQIVEYETKYDEVPRHFFEVCINYKRMHNGAFNFDEALLIAICLKYDGNSNAPFYIKRLLKMPTEE